MLKQFLIIAALLIVILSIGAGMLVCNQISKMEPEYSGKIEEEELKQPVVIARDSSGVIHIRGQNTPDVIFASGFATAQERLWQMEIMRRMALGRLSELFGDTTVMLDKLFLTVGLDTLSELLYKQNSDESREWLQNYASGINAFIEEAGDELPLEFILMNLKPEVWRPQDCLLLNRLLAWVLNFNWKVDFVYWQLSRKLPPEKFSEILPHWENYPDIIHPAPLKREAESISRISRQLTFFLGPGGTGAGSNSWVIAPSRSQSGQAMLANDPHLELQFPSIWIELHLSSPDLEVAGFAIPGAPAIVIGRNENIAWGLTTGMIDDCDYFIEQIDTVNGYYLRDKKEKPLKIRNHMIPVRDKQDITFKSYLTDRGPIFNTIFNASSEMQPVSLKWSGWEESDELNCFIGLARASNREEFDNALRDFGSPAHNFVYADKSGNIGYHLGGLVPVRSYEGGLLPRDGTDSNQKWKGWIPFRQLPALSNPAEGYIVTANNKISDTYPYYLSELWEPPYRALRIHELIRSSDTVSRQDMQLFQGDVKDLMAEKIVPEVIRELLRFRDLTEDEEKVVLLWRGWDYRMDKESISAALYEVFKYYMIQNIFSDEMGEDLFHLFTDTPNYYLRIFAEIVQKEQSGWYDDIGTPIEEGRAEIVRKSLNNALEFLERTISDRMEDWRWGSVHTLTLQHMLGRAPVLDVVLNRGPFPVGGDGCTVNVGMYRYDDPFRMIAGASMRYMVDWGDPGEYFSILAGGNSGNFLSDFYANQAENWLEVSLKRVSLEKIHKFRFEMELYPAKNN